LDQTVPKLAYNVISKNLIVLYKVVTKYKSRKSIVHNMATTLGY